MPHAGFFNGPAVFVWPVGHELRPCSLEIVGPIGAASARWRVATSMTRADAAPYGFGTYRALNYDELVDHPVEMGAFDLLHFNAGGAHHDIAITGRHRADLDRLRDDTQRICQAQIDLFGGAPSSRAPIDHYVFQLLALDDGYGGLEHRASTSLVSGRSNGLPQPGTSASRRRLSQVARSGEPRVFSHLERQAHQARRIPALRSVARGLHHATVGVRGNHLVLRRSRSWFAPD